LSVEISETPRDEGGPSARPYAPAPAFDGEPEWAPLVAYVVEVVRVEGPIHRELLIQRLRQAAGYGRAGVHVRAWLEAIVAEAAGMRQIREWRDAWISPGVRLMIPRDWSGCPAAQRQVEYVPEAEIAAALRAVIGKAFGIARADAGREALALLGFRRVTQKGLERSLTVLGLLIEGGAVVEQGECLRPGPQGMGERRDAEAGS